jgi:DNA-binding NarL/FixJ family response regulator
LVLALLALGAYATLLSQGTVQNHVTNIFGKLHVQDRTQAALKARSLGLV